MQPTGLELVFLNSEANILTITPSKWYIIMRFKAVLIQMVPVDSQYFLENQYFFDVF